MSKLTADQITAAGLVGWTVVDDGLEARLATGDFVTGLAVVNAIGAAAEENDHHPDLDLRYGHLDVRWSSHDVGGVTERDLRLARRTSEIAAAAGVQLG